MEENSVGISEKILDKKVQKGIIITVIAAILAITLYCFLPYEANASKGLALLFFVAVLWFTEAVHITITALMIPVIAVAIGMPAIDPASKLEVALSTKKALSTFADPIIFLFLGGFALATALHMQKLDKKIALKLISMSGAHLGYATLLICLVTAFLSMWISNTATAVMMLPLALGMMGHLDPVKDRNTYVFILLGIAYSASIGGFGTLVGSPPNAIAAAALDMHFNDWMKIGLPFMLMIMPVMFIVLYVVLRPNLNRKIQLEIEEIPWTPRRIATLVLFVCTALAWIFGKTLGDTLGITATDTWVAICAAVFVVLLGLATWRDISVNTEWGVLLLFGGGLTLSAILKDSGASLVLGQEVANVFGNAPHIVIIAVVAVFIVMLTEFTSNTASAALLVPVFATIAAQIGLPKEILVLVIGLGASCAFMLPVATPPNAVVFGSGLIKQKEMMSTGVYLSASCVCILTLYIYFVVL